MYVNILYGFTASLRVYATNMAQEVDFETIKRLEVITHIIFLSLNDCWKLVENRHDIK